MTPDRCPHCLASVHVREGRAYIPHLSWCRWAKRPGRKAGAERGALQPSGGDREVMTPAVPSARSSDLFAAFFPTRPHQTTRSQSQHTGGALGWLHRLSPQVREGHAKRFGSRVGSALSRT